MERSMAPQSLVLTGENYQNWSTCIKNYLIAHDMWDTVEANTEPPNPHEADVEFKAWRKKNAAALHAILISCSSEILSQIREIDSAKLCWDTLVDMHKPQPQNEDEDDEDKESCSDHECVRYRPLCQAIVKEDLVAVESFLHHHPETIRIAFCRGWPALHLATITGNTKLVEKIVELMSEEDLEMVDGNKETALCLAAAIGATRIVELLIKKNKKLVTIPVDGCLPIANACHNGHRDTTWFLYSNTPFELLLPENGTFGAGLLCASLFTKMFDVSLALLRRCPRLAFTKTNSGTIPIVEFSCTSELFLGGGELPVWKRWIYHGIQVQPTAAPSDVRITVVENGKMQQKNFLPQVFSQLQSLGSSILAFSGKLLANLAFPSAILFESRNQARNNQIFFLALMETTLYLPSSNLNKIFNQ